MASPNVRPVRRPISLVERTQRLQEKMIASALVDLEDWSPLPPADLASPDPPPVRWRTSEDSETGDDRVIAGEIIVVPPSRGAA